MLIPEPERKDQPPPMHKLGAVEVVSEAETDRNAPTEGYTDEQVAAGDFPPIMSLLTPELAAEVAAAKVNGEHLYRPALRPMSDEAA